MHIILINIIRGIVYILAIIVSSSNCNSRRDYLESTPVVLLLQVVLVILAVAVISTTLPIDGSSVA